MIRSIVMATAALTLAAGAPAFAAAPCKDAKGKFVKCPAAKPAPTRCRMGGKFVKCGTPGAKPATS